jgi:hypothetical protein
VNQETTSDSIYCMGRLTLLLFTQTERVAGSLIDNHAWATT